MWIVSPTPIMGSPTPIVDLPWLLPIGVKSVPELVEVQFRLLLIVMHESTVLKVK
jgi:hypothetical protein